MNAATKNIIEKLSHVPPSPPTSFIYRVHRQLRDWNEKAYEPLLISIGPYHYERRGSDLKYMEEHKLRYLNDLIKRKEEEEGISKVNLLSRCFWVLDELEDEARYNYAEVITLEKDAFLEMMLLDSCFIIEYFRKFTWSHLRHEREKDPLFKAGWIRVTLDRDLTLLENQIPFSVLKNIYSVIHEAHNPLHLILSAVHTLQIHLHLHPAQAIEESRIAQQSISNVAQRELVSFQITSKTRRLKQEILNDIKHLLDLVHKFMLVEETLEIRKENIKEPKQVESEPIESMDTHARMHTYSAAELNDLGVRFKGVMKSKFYDIRFEKGLLEIPIIRITDGTETRFRNLIAYEEHACHDDIKHIGDYITFLDDLVNSSKDVELLRRQGIIHSLMSDDEAISKMFNKICKNVIMSSKFYYAEVFCDLNKHCKKRRYAWMANLRRNYLSSPWRILSIVVVSLLLTLSTTQTIYTVLSFYHAS